jgi:hypothetical protein
MLFKCLIKMNEYYLVPDPYVEEEILEDSPLKVTEKFLYRFANRYSTSGPTLYMGSLDEALAHSLFDPSNVSICCSMNLETYKSTLFLYC